MKNPFKVVSDLGIGKKNITKEFYQTSIYLKYIIGKKNQIDKRQQWDTYTQAIKTTQIILKLVDIIAYSIRKLLF